MVQYLKSIELTGFKSFGKKERLVFTSPIAAIVGPNGSGKSNCAEAFRYVLGEQSMKSMRSKKGEDLIWGGSPSLSRANRAAVKIIFDNSSRLLDIDFPEVEIERVVHRDGQNEYLLNGSVVRLKDVIRLLAGAHIGGSGYQIISQGEADRILSASPKERREMVEDALGLKLYQHKKAESERKLEETTVNIDKTHSLRRELAPHLKFLRSQAEKIEKAKEMREELTHRMNEYLAREHAWITQEDARLKDERNHLESDISKARAESTKFKDIPTGPVTPLAEEELQSIEDELGAIRSGMAHIERELGRAEGVLENITAPTPIGAEPITLPTSTVRSLIDDMEKIAQESEHAPDAGALRAVIVRIRERLRAFIGSIAAEVSMASVDAEAARGAREKIKELSGKLAALREREVSFVAKIRKIRDTMSKEREVRYEVEKHSLALKAQIEQLEGKRALLDQARMQMTAAQERFEEEVREGIALIGMAVHHWDKAEIPHGALSEPRAVQEKRRRDMERLKIKIEEAGLGSSDAIMREYTQTLERDHFLTKELGDLEASQVSLHNIITELEETIDDKFSEGLTHINVALGTFFSKLFGGGEAKLYVEKQKRVQRVDADSDDEESEVGIVAEETFPGLAISVSLPRKKVRGLEVLSGGERALTSIALIFAISQVNPPPFLILDETDAALDEANSKRYADMLHELGKHSQLVVITHNRATMAAAGELYGVTMSSDGVSKLLSVKLEEAARVAK